MGKNKSFGTPKRRNKAISNKPTMVSITVDDHITLRSYVPDDADALFNAVNNSRKHLHPWLDWVAKTTKQEHSLRYIQDSLHQINMQEGMALGIFYDGIVVGGIGMHKWEHDTKRAQVGYWITKDYEGRGIIRKSLHKFVGHLFDKIGVNKIEIRFVPANKRSARVAEGLGCKIEGVIRKSVMRNGMPEDIVVAGLLSSEWLGAESKTRAQ